MNHFGHFAIRQDFAITIGSSRKKRRKFLFCVEGSLSFTELSREGSGASRECVLCNCVSLRLIFAKPRNMSFGRAQDAKRPAYSSDVLPSVSQTTRGPPPPPPHRPESSWGAGASSAAYGRTTRARPGLYEEPGESCALQGLTGVDLLGAFRGSQLAETDSFSRKRKNASKSKLRKRRYGPQPESWGELCANLDKGPRKLPAFLRPPLWEADVAPF